MSLCTHKRALSIAIDLDAITHNLEVARVRSGGQKLFAVVKADAYGHGAVQVANALTKADSFAVVTVAEAIELREANIDKPILVLHGAQSQADCEAFYQYQLWPVIHCAEQLDWFAKSSQVDRLTPWIKIDTGMGRLGFQAAEAMHVLSENQQINWMGAMTHFASADFPQSGQTQQQIDRFNSIVEPLRAEHVQSKQAHLRQPQFSLANSAGILAWREARADWARPGIMLYGSNPVKPSPTVEQVKLRAAMRVSAPIISKKIFNAGDSVGYAASYICETQMPVAIVAIGYGDGIPRVLDNSASVLVRGDKCPIIGRVSMDSIALDVRSAPDVQVGEEAILWGEEHPIELFAKAANTIGYELMTSIKGQRQY